MLYPTMEIVPGRGFIPKVTLPRNFKELVPKFYEQERKRTVEDYIKNLKETDLSKTEIRTQWEEKRGLVNISLGTHGGFDLNDRTGHPHFQEHNLGGTNSYIAMAIATKYVSELLKSE